jgi:hypothetical protein
MDGLAEHIQQVLTGIWTLTLGLPLRRHAGVPAETGSLLAGRVDITGAWEGSVSLRCPAAFAREAAAILFGVAPGSTSEDQTRDALGELTNMTGGSLKALFPGPSRLVPPAVLGASEQVPAPGSRLLGEVAFDCQGHLLLVTVVERDGATAGSR